MSINKELKAITGKYVEDYKTICNRSREERIKQLRPGEPIPKESTLYGDRAKADFKELADSHRAKANEILERELKAVNDKLTEAPSTEAVNSMQLLKMRDRVTLDEINGLMIRYGDNNQIYDTLKDVARQHGINEYAFDRNPLRVRAEMLSDLQHNINSSLTVNKAERGYATEAFISLINASIDDACPE